MLRLVLAIALATLPSCRDRPVPIRHDPATPPSVSASASSPAPSASAPANPQLDCYSWLTEEHTEPIVFPHPVHPGFAMRFVHEWGERHHAAKQQSIGFENVHCPKARCIEPEDCWYRVRLDDAASTAVSHLVLWLDVHAVTGDVRWEEVGPDGGLTTRVEPSKWPKK